MQPKPSEVLSQELHSLLGYKEEKQAGRENLCAHNFLQCLVLTPYIFHFRLSRAMLVADLCHGYHGRRGALGIAGCSCEGSRTGLAQAQPQR